MGKYIKMWDLQIANLRDNRNWRGNPCPEAFEKGIAFWKLRNVHFVFGRVFSKQGKKNVIKLEADPSIMAELEDVECCTVNGTEFDIGSIVGVVGLVVVVIVAN